MKSTRNRATAHRVLSKTLILFAAIVITNTGQAVAQYYGTPNLQQLWDNTMQMYNQQMQQMQELTESLEKQRAERLERLEVESSYVYKDKATGKYGGVFFFNDNVGINNGSNPIKVAMVYRKAGDSNSSLKPQNVTSNCVFWGNAIIVSPVLTRPSDSSADYGFVIVLFGKKSSVFKLFSEKLMSAEELKEEETDYIQNYDRYVQLCQLVYNATMQQMQNGSAGNSFTPSFPNSSTQGGSSSRQETCSYCLGKGWVVGGKTPCYTSGNRYCDECRQTVSCSHSHDRCPSCGGTGKR
jgi:hypothetical protein